MQVAEVPPDTAVRRYFSLRVSPPPLPPAHSSILQPGDPTAVLVLATLFEEADTENHLPGDVPPQGARGDQGKLLPERMRCDEVRGVSVHHPRHRQDGHRAGARDARDRLALEVPDVDGLVQVSPHSHQVLALRTEGKEATPAVMRCLELGLDHASRRLPHHHLGRTRVVAGSHELPVGRDGRGFNLSLVSLEVYLPPRLLDHPQVRAAVEDFPGACDQRVITPPPTSHPQHVQGSDPLLLELRDPRGFLQLRGIEVVEPTAAEALGGQRGYVPVLSHEVLQLCRDRDDLAEADDGA
eukprot:753281-Hanusia_phi.AAC.6